MKDIHVKDNVIYYYPVQIHSQRLYNRKTIDILHSLESDVVLLLSEDEDGLEFACESEELDLGKWRGETKSIHIRITTIIIAAICFTRGIRAGITLDDKTNAFESLHADFVSFSLPLLYNCHQSNKRKEIMRMAGRIPRTLWFSKS